MMLLESHSYGRYSNLKEQSVISSPKKARSISTYSHILTSLIISTDYSFMLNEVKQNRADPY
jgi:hypothetical protein